VFFSQHHFERFHWYFKDFTGFFSSFADYEKLKSAHIRLRNDVQKFQSSCRNFSSILVGVTTPLWIKSKLRLRCRSLQLRNWINFFYGLVSWAIVFTSNHAHLNVIIDTNVLCLLSSESQMLFFWLSLVFIRGRLLSGFHICWRLPYFIAIRICVFYYIVIRISLLLVCLRSRYFFKILVSSHSWRAFLGLPHLLKTAEFFFSYQNLFASYLFEEQIIFFNILVRSSFVEVLSSDFQMCSRPTILFSSESMSIFFRGREIGQNYNVLTKTRILFSVTRIFVSIELLISSSVTEEQFFPQRLSIWRLLCRF